MSAGVATDALKAHLVDLQMPGGLEVVDSLLERLDHGAISSVEAMEQLLAAQVTLRRQRRLQTALRTSRLPGVKTVDAFDFAFQPSIDRAQILNLHQLGFLDRKENIIFLGPTGVGQDPSSRLTGHHRCRARPAGLLRHPGGPGAIYGGSGTPRKAQGAAGLPQAASPPHRG